LDVVAFALIIGSDESQSKSQFITQSLGENTIGYRAVKQFFYPPDNVLQCQAMLVRNQSFNFLVMLWLENVMFTKPAHVYFSTLY